jgi:hypothetical protein
MTFREQSAASGLGATAAAVVAASLLGVCSCSSARSGAPAPLRQRPALARISLDPELSPVPFRWLADDAVLVTPDVGERKLALFGNYVERAALDLPRARLTVWDDESAWKLAGDGEGSPEAVAHKRAEYVKDPSAAEAVELYVVFGRSGKLVYQRDFRSYPLSELD